MTRRITATSALAAAALSVPLVLSGAALASLRGADARPATGAERHAIEAIFAREDGSVSEIRGVYVSRANSGLAVACAHTPEAGTYAYVFTRTHGSWRYAASGRAGRAGNAADRRLEQAC